ncbi:MAG: type 1 glutamine amidotransferase [Acidimicrobiia bacterium]|nr:type 1 glutamine amidotransferase [Acidimicrobiia bacterium]
MRALVVGNHDDFDPGFVGHRLRAHGYGFTELHREHPDQWPGLGGADLVLTLGSEWNVYRPETAELVEAEAALMREVVERDVPLLAICFGAQVLSHALGGTVSLAPVPEIGWVDVGPVDAPGVPSGPWMQWHLDVFTVPDGFTELAANDMGPQLVRGPNCAATQFHPEATETMIARWLRSGGAEQLAEHGGAAAELLAETRANVERSRVGAEALVDWFLGSVVTS